MENYINQLLFSEDESCAQIFFGNGKKSSIFETKEEAMNSILRYYRNKKISNIEFFLFTRQIITAKKLISTSSLEIKKIEEFVGIKRPKIKDPYFRKCNNPNCVNERSHVYFYNGNNKKLFPFRIYFQYDGRGIVNLLYESGEIDEETVTSLNVLLQLTGIPEEPKKIDPHLN